MSELLEYTIKKLARNRCKILTVALTARGVSTIEELKVPSTIDGDKVVSIGKGAFQSLRTKVVINKLIIPKTIENIYESAFFMVAIKELIFEENSSIRQISDNAFYSTNLEKLDINAKNPLKIGNSSFSNTSIKELDLSKCVNIYQLEENCFAYSKIEKVKFHPNIKALGRGMFRKNPLRDIGFMAALKECTIIPDECFVGCQISKIPDEVFKNFAIYDFAFASNDFEELEIPEYANLYYQAFSNNTNLKTVVSNLPVIPSGLFKYCGNLEKVIIKNATEIKLSAFRFCSIKELFFEDKNLQVINDYAFANNKLEELIIDDTNISVIKKSAFESNNLKSVKLPFYLTQLSSSAFSENEGLFLKRADFPFAEIIQE